MAYVIAIGIDKGESNLLKISLQFATPSSSLNGESTGSSSDSESTVSSVECSTIDSGINLINSYISGKINYKFLYNI
jgi:spore germination protein KC